MKENAFQQNLIKEIKERFPGSIVMKNDSSYIQGIPDLTILYGSKWAALEVKKDNKASHQPNQDYYVNKMDNMSYAKFICPENKKEILDVVRDKKTIFTMIVLPVILYPLIFLAAMQVVSFIETTQKEQNYLIAYQNVPDKERQVLNDWITGDEDGLDYSIQEIPSRAPEQDLEDEN